MNKLTGYRSEWLNVISLYSEEHAKRWKLATDAVHKEGGSM
jgi:2,4-dienoyl-CoA reductase-like NADH-dependent reductase (Old Yellow Enzyme family)